MKRPLFLAIVLGVSPLLAAAAEAAAAPDAKSSAAAPSDGAAEQVFAYLKAPLFAEEFASVPIARVEDEVITVRDLTEALAGAHGAHTAGSKAGTTDVIPILDRLIDGRLLAVEARNTGIDELPETKEAVESYRASTGQEMLKARVTAGIKADAAEVDRLYSEAAREWKVRSALFVNESDAIRTKAEVDAGKKFEDLVAQAVADGKARGGEEAQHVGRAKLLPNVTLVLQTMKPGDVSAPVKVQEGFAVLKLEDVRTADDPKARAEAEQVSLARLQKAALKKYYDGLVKRYARTDGKLLKRLDFDAKRPGIVALLKDKRVLSRIAGAKPITVGELAETLAQGFFHGTEGAAEKRKINRQKLDVFDGILSARIVPLEVRRLGIEETPEFKRRVANHEKSLLFGKFVERVIVPQVKVAEDAARKYYEEHKKEFTYPAFYKLQSLAFANVKHAQAAVDKLRAGTDFKWLNANSEGQIKEPDRKARLDGTIAATSLPKELAAALAGAKAGDHRLYADPSSQFYAVHVVDVVLPQEQPFEEVERKITERLFYEQLNKSVKDWTDKLRKASDVKVFITKMGS